MENYLNTSGDSWGNLSTPPFPHFRSHSSGHSLKNTMFEVALETPFQPCCKGFSTDIATGVNRKIGPSLLLQSFKRNSFTDQSLPNEGKRESHNCEGRSNATGTWTAFTLARIRHLGRARLPKVSYSYVKRCRKAALQEPG